MSQILLLEATLRSSALPLQGITLGIPRPFLWTEGRVSCHSVPHDSSCTFWTSVQATLIMPRCAARQLMHINYDSGSLSKRHCSCHAVPHGSRTRISVQATSARPALISVQLVVICDDGFVSQRRCSFYELNDVLCRAPSDPRVKP